MKRSREKEMMDLPGNDPGLLEEDLANLRKINRYLGGYRGIQWALRRFIDARHISTFSLLDVGTGSGDILLMILRWAKENRISANLVGLDREPVTARAGRLQTRHFSEIAIVRGDGTSPPFRRASFDFILASQLLHHFSEEEIVMLLQNWSKLVRRGIFVSDLIRHPVAYYGIRMLTSLWTRNEMTRTDAPLSVQRAFTLAEWKELFNRSRIGQVECFTFFPFRLFAFFSLGG